MELPYLSLFLLQLESQFFGLVVKLHQSPVVAVVTVVAVVVVVGDGQVVGGDRVYVLVLTALGLAVEFRSGKIFYQYSCWIQPGPFSRSRDC